NWPENSVQEFQFGIDVPQWTQEFVQSTVKDNFKNPLTPLSTSYPVLLAGDDGRNDRMYDGGHRGGHSYFAPQFIEARNWYVHFYQQQFWPADNGWSPAVHVAEAGHWRTNNPIAEFPNFHNDEDVWV